MAPVKWSILPGDILLIIVKLLNSDVDLLRLRSVCSSWRVSLPTRMKPFSFPVKVPPFISDSSSPNLRDGGQYFLNYSTLYRLSPLECAGDSSDGWLFRVLEVKPNTFSLLKPLLPEKIECNPDMIPKGLDLLDYRISEICKCYRLDFVDFNDVTESVDLVRKVIVLWNFVEDCDFAVLVLASNNRRSQKNNVMRYWRFGDKDWTPIDTKNYEFDDVIFLDGKCYAIGCKGELVSFGSEFNLTLVYSSDYDLLGNHNNFVVYKSELYIVSKIYDREPDEYSSEFEGRYSSGDEYELTPPQGRYSYDSEEDEEGGSPYYISTGGDEYSDEEISIGKDKYIVENESTDDEDEGSDDEEEGRYEYEDDQPDEEEADSIKIPLRVKIFRMSYGCVHFKALADDEFFLSSDDVSIPVSTKDFGGCKGNCVYMAHRHFSYCDEGIEYGDGHAVFDFDRRRTRSLIVETTHDRAKIYWPPPNWLCD